MLVASVCVCIMASINGILHYAKKKEKNTPKQTFENFL